MRPSRQIPSESSVELHCRQRWFVTSVLAERLLQEAVSQSLHSKLSLQGSSMRTFAQPRVTLVASSFSKHWWRFNFGQNWDFEAGWSELQSDSLHWWHLGHSWLLQPGPEHIWHDWSSVLLHLAKSASFRVDKQFRSSMPSEILIVLTSKSVWNITKITYNPSKTGIVQLVAACSIQQSANAVLVTWGTP